MVLCVREHMEEREERGPKAATHCYTYMSLLGCRTPGLGFVVCSCVSTIETVGTMPAFVSCSDLRLIRAV